MDARLPAKSADKSIKDKNTKEKNNYLVFPSINRPDVTKTNNLLPDYELHGFAIVKPTPPLVYQEIHTYKYIQTYKHTHI